MTTPNEKRDHLTVIRRVFVKSQCARCSHTWPYKEGDENRPCPACRGGSPQFWQTEPYTR